MNGIYYCVIGIEMGMTCASKVEILGTFSKVEEAEKFIKNHIKGRQHSVVDILETVIDKPNIDLQNVLCLN